MQQHKLIQLLKKLERREMTRFREFAESPYHNKHDVVRQLVQYLSDIFPQYTDSNCDRHLLFRQLFGRQPHDQKKLAVHFTYTLRLLEQFLQSEQLRQQPALQQQLLLQRLRSKKQFKHFEKILSKLEKNTDETKQRDADWYFHRYRAAAESDYYFTLVSERRRDQSLQYKQDYLNRYFLAVKLRDACEMAVRQRILKVSYDDPMAAIAVQQVAQSPDTLQSEPAINLYYRLYLVITEQSPAYYFEARAQLQQQQSALPDEELKNIYNYLQNYCIQRINAGEARFLQEIFQLYQAQLERGLLLEDGWLSEWHYKNIVTTALRLEELDWVYQFIEAYKKRLPEASRDNAYRFNLAAYYYAAEQYARVLELLTQVEYSDLRYSLGAKALLLRTYYDLEEYEALFSLVDSFKQYLIRNKLMADDRRLGYHNLFKLTRRAATLRYNQGYYAEARYTKELQRLQRDIGQAKAIFNKGWLLERVEELESGRV
ncbi:MAG: hypothetical protein GVY26_09775 [Bacteroidetes bacterium]|jgi:hypothetical protein|nr:hypothetical protein [Bacteroidota bacterium]